jgi:aspartyl protease family protein
MGGVGSRPADVQTAKHGEPAPKPSTVPRTATVRDDARGHFQVEGVVQGRRVDFLVDTGASSVTLRERDASRLGINPAPRDYTGRASTANGTVRYAPVRLPWLEVNGIRIYDVQAAVLPDEALSTNLLGMSFLSRVRRFEMANGRLVMEQ